MSEINLPEIGETITTDKAIELAAGFGFTPIADELKANPEKYNSWLFDGASIPFMTDQKFMDLFGFPNLVQSALKHDVQYAYGSPFSLRSDADSRFLADLLRDSASSAKSWAIVAFLMYYAVRLFGSGKLIKTSYSWGFAKKDK